MAIIPSVVSIPPNMITAAFEIASSSPRASAPPTAAATSDDPARRPIVSPTSELSAAKAARAAGVTAPPAVTCETASTIDSYHESTSSALASRPRARVTTVAASGPERNRRRSARPAGRIASISRSVSAETSPEKWSRTGAARNGGANGRRWRSCSAPSVSSMLRPTTWAVEKRSSSTVKLPASLIARRARSRRVTSQASSTGTQETGSCSRRRARWGWGSPASSATVSAAPSGYRASRLRPGPFRLPARVPIGSGRCGAQWDTAAAASSETRVSVWKRSSAKGAISSGVRPVATSSASVMPTIGAALKP